ncbi:MAG: L,D-transpeptidase family protein [Thermochromatium sp.]
MTTPLKILTFTCALLQASVGLLVVIGLVGCDGLARLAAKPDTLPPEAVTTEVAMSGPDQSPPETETKPEKDQRLSAPLYEWQGEGRSITHIIINTNEQKARFYSGDKEIGWSTVATGVPGYPTPTGRFQVTEKIENKRSNLYGKIYGQGGRVLHANAKVGRDPIPEGARFEGAHMPFFMRLTDDGVGLHAGPIPNPGRPASHGCIRLPSKIASVVFQHVSNGTAVTIEGRGPNYGDYVAKQRANAARRAEEQRIAAEARKAQQATQAESTPDPNGQSQIEAGTPAPESHAVAKDDAAATLAAQALDAAHARETRMRESRAQPETVVSDANAPAVYPQTGTTQSDAQTAAPSAPTTPDLAQSSPVKNTSPPAPTSAETTAPAKPVPEVQESPDPIPETAEPTSRPAPATSKLPAVPAVAPVSRAT